MKYFYDCEFLEGKQKEQFPISLFRKETKPTIDLISIGIVAEDGREYYQISKDFNLKEAWNRHDIVIDVMSGDMRNKYPQGRKREVYWIRENILKPIFKELWYEKCLLQHLHYVKNDFTFSNFKKLIALYGKTNSEIAQEVFEFISKDTLTLGKHKYYNVSYKNIELYGYYSAYDHVVFCWLFGKMMDLPNGFPMYTRDLKQMLDEKYMLQENKYPDKTRLEAWLQDVKRLSGYPKQEKEHNALADAIWNKKLHEFLKSI